MIDKIKKMRLVNAAMKSRMRKFTTDPNKRKFKDDDIDVIKEEHENFVKSPSIKRNCIPVPKKYH